MRRGDLLTFLSLLSPQRTGRSTDKWQSIMDELPLPRLNYVVREETVTRAICAPGGADEKDGCPVARMGLPRGRVERQRGRYYGLAGYATHSSGDCLPSWTSASAREHAGIFRRPRPAVQYDHGFNDKQPFYTSPGACR